MTAADIVNTYDEERLANILYLYGELKNSRKLASVIVKARSGQNIRTIGEFLEIIKPLFGREREKKELVLYFMDGTMQRVSLASFVLAMGMLVDNAIVIIDGILVDLKAGKSRMEAMLLVFILYSALMLFTGFSLATCQAFTTTQATITNSTSRAIPIKSNRSISIRSLNCSNHIWPVK